MTRPTIDQTHMANAVNWSRRSTCSRSHVGCVIALGGRGLSTGYNGAPAGMPHCNHECDCEALVFPDGHVEHHEECYSGPHGCVAVHAEANAITWAARNGIALLGSTLYTTLTPCVKCAQLIVNAGIVRVVWRTVYRDVSGLDLVVASGISTEQVFEENFGL